MSYPHVTKYDTAKGLVHFITNPDKTASVGDIIFDSFNQRFATGEMQEKFLMPRRTVVEVIEERTARGDHATPFKPVFQLLKVA